MKALMAFKRAHKNCRMVVEPHLETSTPILQERMIESLQLNEASG